MVKCNQSTWHLDLAFKLHTTNQVISSKKSIPVSRWITYGKWNKSPWYLALAPKLNTVYKGITGSCSIYERTLFCPFEVYIACIPTQSTTMPCEMKNGPWVLHFFLGKQILSLSPVWSLRPHLSQTHIWLCIPLCILSRDKLRPFCIS